MTITEMSLAAALVAASTAAGVTFWNAQSARLEAGRKVDVFHHAVMDWAAACEARPADCPIGRGFNVGAETPADMPCMRLAGDSEYWGWRVRRMGGGYLVELTGSRHPRAEIAAFIRRWGFDRGSRDDLWIAEFRPPPVRDQQTRAWMLPDAPLDPGVSC